MMGIVLDPAQINSAPPEVRRWIMEQLAQSFGPHLDPGAGKAPEPHAALPELLQCDLRQAVALLEAIQEDRLSSSVLLEFGRDTPDAVHAPGLYGLRIETMLRDLHLPQADALTGCLERITTMLQAVLQDQSAMLFGYGRGCCFVSDATHRTLRLLLHGLMSRVQPPQAAMHPGAVHPIGAATPLSEPSAQPATAPLL